jgi:hypothetical protein
MPQPDRSNLIATVMVDLDSTLCDTSLRRHLAPEDKIKGSWEKFSNACMTDDPVPGVVEVVRLLYPSNRIVICSGRNHTAYEATKMWLEIENVPYDELLLCNYLETPLTNGEYKVMHIERQRQLGYVPVLFLEDWPASATAIERAGVPVLVVNPNWEGYFTEHDVGY